MLLPRDAIPGESNASMGPRSENRGYVGIGQKSDFQVIDASMGPRSENRGYGSHLGHALWTQGRLQWVHGPRTVVMEE